MNWKVRHEGSPQTVDNLTPGQIAQGLEEGLWEPTDEVQGPDDLTWTPIESHPVFADVARSWSHGHRRPPRLRWDQACVK